VRPPRHFVAVVAVLLASAVGGAALGGCALARNGLGTRSSQCFRVLPEAKQAVGKRVVFAGVLSSSGGTLVKVVNHMPNHEALPDSLTGLTHETACLVAYRGDFTLSGVQRGWAPLSGPYRAAIVVVRPFDERVVVTVLFRKLPRSIDFRDGSPG
jgi:hypothetical protein